MRAQLEPVARLRRRRIATTAIQWVPAMPIKTRMGPVLFPQVPSRFRLHTCSVSLLQVVGARRHTHYIIPGQVVPAGTSANPIPASTKILAVSDTGAHATMPRAAVEDGCTAAQAASNCTTRQAAIGRKRLVIRVGYFVYLHGPTR